ncbi:MAG: methyl-accepting chemotaxis protein, partial [Psychromonas sp.]|nr:methyl-accepting chemotaxis protein [Psychromonas sp.]
INAIEDLQSSHNLTINNINQLEKSAEQLLERLADIEDVATRTQDLARKTTTYIARSGKENDQFTLVANQVTHLATKTANNIAQISPLLKQFQTQINELSIPLKHNEQQLELSQQQLTHSNEIFETLKNELQKQQYSTTNIAKNDEQLSTKVLSMFASLKNSLNLIKESSEKSDANNLFIQDLSKISLQLEQLSDKYKLDDKESRARRGNDKRLYPRINNQLKVSLQQSDNRLQGLTQDLSLSGLQLKSMESVHFNHRTPVSFTITPPNINSENSGQPVELLGDVVYYEQIKDSYYYGVRFHPLSETDKRRLQQIFDYFEKKSEFKS